MAALTPEQADALLSKGLISPEQHASFAPPMASSMPPEAMSSPAAPPPNIGPPPPPPEPIPLDGGVSGGGPMMSVEPPNMTPESPPGEVRVGNITQLNTPAPPKVAALDATKMSDAELRGRLGLPATPSSGGPMLGFAVQEQGAAPAGQKPTTAKPGDPRMGFQKEREAEIDKRIAAQQEAGEARQQKAKELAEQADANAKAFAAKEAENEVARAKDQEETKAAIADVNRRVDEYAAKKVDPDRWWRDQGTGGQVLASLQSAIGGFVEGYSRGAIKNDVPARINAAIERDIRAQEADLATGAKAIDSKRGVLHDMMQVTQNKEAARAAARLGYLQNIEMQAKATAAKYDPKLENAQTQEILSTLNTMKTDQRDELDKTMRRERAAAQAQAQAQAREKMKYERGKDADAAARDWARITNDTVKANAEAAKAGKENQVAIPGADGKPTLYEAASPEDAKKVRDATEVYLNLNGDLKRLREMRQEYGREVVNRNAIAKSEALSGRIRTSLKELEKLGALSGSDYELLDSQVPASPLSASTMDDTIFGAIDETQSGLERGYQNALRARLKGGNAPNITPEAKAASVPTTKAPGG